MGQVWQYQGKPMTAEDLERCVGGELHIKPSQIKPPTTLDVKGGVPGIER